MAAMHLLQFFLGSFIVILIAQVCYCQSLLNHTAAADLRTALLTNYVTSTRPSASTAVDVGFGISHISKLDTIDQKLGVVGFVLAVWQDPRLGWNPSAYAGINNLYLTVSDIWVPPLLLNNAAEEVGLLSDDSSLTNIPVQLFDTGHVYWLAPANFEANCEINIQYYPFDKQSCKMTISSWMYTLTELALTTNTFSEVNTDLYTENGEWSFDSSSTHTSSVTLLGLPSATTEFTMRFTRKYSYYLLNMLLPVLFLNALGIFVFILPAESGEKISYSLTILLSLSVVMTLVSDNIPPTSTHTCLLSVYLLMAFVLNSLVVLAVVLNLKIHHLADQGCHVSNKLQRFTQTFLSRITFSRQNKVDVSSSKADQENGVKADKRNNLNEDKKSIVAAPSPAAWKKVEEEEYSYNDIAIMLDKVFLVTFSALNIIVLLAFLIAVTVGSS